MVSVALYPCMLCVVLSMDLFVLRVCYCVVKCDGVVECVWDCSIG